MVKLFSAIINLNVTFQIMKTRIATLTLLLGLFISTTAFANEPVPASKYVAKTVADYIEKELEYPEFAIETKYEGDVVVKIVIEEDGTFDVVQANAHNEKMKNSVIEMIEELDSDTFDAYAGQSVLVKISFDLRIY